MAKYDSARDPDGAAPILVCGGGMAGLTAALTCLEAGDRVVIVEKAPKLGGSALLSAGSLWTLASVKDLERSEFKGNEILQQVVIEGIDAGVAWLSSQGVHTADSYAVLGYGRCWDVEPVAMIGCLEQRVRTMGGDILLETGLDAYCGERSSNGHRDGIRVRHEPHTCQGSNSCDGGLPREC